MFAKKLKEIMEIRDMTAADLSRASGLSEASISAILKGRSADPKLSTLEKIAKALRISMDYFREEDTLGPSDLLAHLEPDERKLVLDDQFLPWVKLTKEAIDEGIPPDVVEQIIRIIKYNTNK